MKEERIRWVTVEYNRLILEKKNVYLTYDRQKLWSRIKNSLVFEKYLSLQGPFNFLEILYLLNYDNFSANRSRKLRGCKMSRKNRQFWPFFVKLIGLATFSGARRVIVKIDDKRPYTSVKDMQLNKYTLNLFILSFNS